MSKKSLARASWPLVLAILLLSGCSGTSHPKSSDSLEHFNHRLGPAYSQWLMGAAGRVATPEEADRFLALTSDEEAATFVEDFWQARSGRIPGTLKTYRSAFEERCEEADKLYSERGRAGRYTDRGTIFVLYGKPDESEFKDASMKDYRTVEVWTYSKEADPGLDGTQPDTDYRFIKEDGLTVFYRGTTGLRPRLPEIE